MQDIPPFHRAIPVDNLELCRTFYRDILGCEEGRSSNLWVDFNFFGHQLVIHYKQKETLEDAHTNPVDGKHVPVPHFGVVLNFKEWEQLASRVKPFISHFIIEPYIRFKGEPGEQGTMFFSDPSGNALEFKAFNNIEQQLFAK